MTDLTNSESTVDTAADDTATTDAADAAPTEDATAEVATDEAAAPTEVAPPDAAPTEDAADAADESEVPAPEPRQSPYDRPGKWFVLHTQSGYEKKVKTNLEARISSMNMEHRIYEVVIPTEEVVEFKNGKKAVVDKKCSPAISCAVCVSMTIRGSLFATPRA